MGLNEPNFLVYILRPKLKGGVIIDYSRINIKPGVKGQGDKEPAARRFTNHVIIIYENVLYDPSYGKKFIGDAALKNWENMFLESVEYCIGSDGNTPPNLTYDAPEPNTPDVDLHLDLKQ